MMKMKYLLAAASLLATFGGDVRAQVVLNPVPGRVLGQFARPATLNETLSPPSVAPNLVEGREFYEPQGVALDTRFDPPILYVVDTRNNRVLAWRDARSFSGGSTADLVIGQQDLQGTSALGPGTSFTSGLSAPTGAVVDGEGRVWVADAGNNRILRFPFPFNNQGKPQIADFVIGQTSLNGRNANQGLSTATALTIRTNATAIGGTQQATLAFDRDRNLWFSDAGNNRVLRYSAATVSGGPNTSGNNAAVPADLVLGQNDFSATSGVTASVTSPITYANRTNKSKFRNPSSIAFDSAGNLFVSDDLARILVFRPPFVQVGQPALRIMGVTNLQLQPGQELPVVDATEFGYRPEVGLLSLGGNGVFTIENTVFVVNTANSRILRFDPYDQWPQEVGTNISPKAVAVIGQDSFNIRNGNRFLNAEPSPRSLNFPTSAAFANGEVFVADTFNNRIVVYPDLRAGDSSSEAYRLLGQLAWEFRSPNLIEGREFSSATLQQSVAGGVLTLTLGPGFAIDRTSETPRLYIADSGNNRILGFADANRAKAGDYASLVIGQVDFTRSLVNSPGMDASKPTDTGLVAPTGVLVDSEGNLWVADTGNGRILRFPKPFEQQAPIRADIVIGQADFSARDFSVSDRTLGRPVSLAMTAEGNLVVSDVGHNRILLYAAPLYSGMPANIVLGQPDFITADSGNTPDKFSIPLKIALDGDSQLYAVDFLNNRIQVYSNVNGQINGANAAFTMAVTGVRPTDVAVSRKNGKIYVTDNAQSRVIRFPDLFTFQATGQAEQQFTAYGPRSIALDGDDAVWISDSANRILTHYPQLSVRNAANEAIRVAPGMLSTIRIPGVSLAAFAGEAGAPYPQALNDIEILVDGIPAPIGKITSDSVRVVIPKAAPTNGTSEFLVRRQSNGQILATQYVLMFEASPAFFTLSGNPGGQVRALNADGTANSPSSPAARGTEITLFLTGFGTFEGMPEDGVASVASVPTAGFVRALIGAQIDVPIVSSEMDPNEPGVWRLKLMIPATTAPVSNVIVLVQVKTIPSNNTGIQGAALLQNTIAVR